MKMLKRWCGNVYNTTERNYQTFNKIKAKSSFQHGGRYKSYYFVEISPLNASPLKFRVLYNFYVLCQFFALARLQLIV